MVTEGAQHTPGEYLFRFVAAPFLMLFLLLLLGGYSGSGILALFLAILIFSVYMLLWAGVLSFGTLYLMRRIADKKKLVASQQNVGQQVP